MRSCCRWGRRLGQAPGSGVRGKAGGVQVGDAACLNLEGLALDVVARDLLAGLADADGLAGLAADVNGLALPLPLRGGRVRGHGQLWQAGVGLLQELGGAGRWEQLWTL